MILVSYFTSMPKTKWQMNMVGTIFERDRAVSSAFRFA